MLNKAGSFKTQMLFIEAVRKFDKRTKAQCPKLLKHMRTKKGKEELIKLFKDVGGTDIHKHIKLGVDPVTVIMAYFVEHTLEEVFATFPVNNMQAQTLSTEPYTNDICEAFRLYRFQIKL